MIALLDGVQKLEKSLFLPHALYGTVGEAVWYTEKLSDVRLR